MLCRWRRFIVAFGSVAACLGGLAGCAIHPQPGDFSRASTVDIVRSIRCEARAGVESVLAGLKPQERSRAEQIIKATAIGYDFDFLIDENNHAGGGPGQDDEFLTLKRALAPKPTKLDLSRGRNLHRQNHRTFTIIEPL